VRQHLQALRNLGVVLPDGTKQWRAYSVRKYRINLAALPNIPEDIARKRRQAAARTREARADVRESRRLSQQARTRKCTAVHDHGAQKLLHASTVEPLHMSAKEPARACTHQPVLTSSNLVTGRSAGHGAVKKHSEHSVGLRSAPERLNPRSGATGAPDADLYQITQR